MREIVANLKLLINDCSKYFHFSSEKKLYSEIKKKKKLYIQKKMQC